MSNRNFYLVVSPRQGSTPRQRDSLAVSSNVRDGKYSVSMGNLGLGTKNNCAGEAQQQIAGLDAVPTEKDQ
jgi:hypothetical protein